MFEPLTLFTVFFRLSSLEITHTAVITCCVLPLRSNSPLKRTTPDHANPCSRDSVLSALRESRKRSFAVDDEEDPELILRPTKR